MTTPDGVRVTGENGEGYDEVLTSPALAFLADLHRTFDARRLELLQVRAERYEKLAAGGTLTFLPEKHIIVDGQPMSGSLVDFGLYFFHCAQRQIDAGKGPYFYLAKMESHLEARLWNDVFVRAQDLPQVALTLDHIGPRGG